MRSVEIPVGLILITAVLFLLAGINVFTKTVATISGVSFTAVLFVLFTICERRFGRGAKKSEEEFRFKVRENLSTRSVPVRSGNTLVAASDPLDVERLENVLEENDPKRSDVVLLFVDKNTEQSEGVTDARAIQTFSKAVRIAEKVGSLWR